MTTTINSISDYLNFVSQSRSAFINTSKLVYNCVEQLVLTHGRLYDTIIKRPAWIKRGRKKECYSNCLKELIYNPNKLIYCEGFATSVIPVQHAWLLFEGQLIDPTWDDQIEQQNREYFGIAFNTDYVKHTALKTGYYGVLDNFAQGHPMLTGVHKPADFLYSENE